MQPDVPLDDDHEYCGVCGGTGLAAISEDAPDDIPVADCRACGGRGVVPL
jgi:hypothetical protein